MAPESFRERIRERKKSDLYQWQGATIAHGWDGRTAAASAVVYNGTDTSVFTPGRTQEQTPTILMVGNLLAGKGHELVLRALARVKDSHPGLQCRIIGEGADRDRFAIWP